MTDGIGLAGERLGQQLQRADRRLELVAHVGHEVATHTLDAAQLRDVLHKRRRAEQRVTVEQRRRPQTQHDARRAEQLQLAVASTHLRTRHSRMASICGRGDARPTPRVAIPLGGPVAKHLVAIGIDDDDAIGHFAERRGQTVSLIFEVRGVVGHLGQRLFERSDRRLLLAAREGSLGISRTGR